MEVEEPVSVGKTGSFFLDRGFRIPAPPSDDARWVIPGQSIRVAGLNLADGMFYVGTSLRTPDGLNEPSLINPSLELGSFGDPGQRVFQHPSSYQLIFSSARRAYLNWIATGKCGPRADIGYVFLYFYGLERRVIVDAPKSEEAAKDLPFISRELRRLLGIYGKHPSFHHYATGLLQLIESQWYPEQYYLLPIPHADGPQPSLPLRLALGQAARDAAPLPPHVALAYTQQDGRFSFHKPQPWWAELFNGVFKLRYTERFGAGLLLPRGSTEVSFKYTPASSGLRQYRIVSIRFEDVPDVTSDAGLVIKLQGLLEACTAEFEAFRRYVGRTPERAQSLEAALLLPAAVLPDDVRNIVAKLQGRVAKSMTVLSANELLALFKVQGPLSKTKFTKLAQMLEASGIAFEPDVLAGARTPKPEELLVLFAVEPADPVNRSTPAYVAAALTLELASALATADDEFSPVKFRQVKQWARDQELFVDVCAELDPVFDRTLHVVRAWPLT
jgi:hypothetical protein